MLAEQIKKFISDLASKCVLPIDSELHKQLDSYFALKDSKTSLSAEDYRVLEEIFARRRAAIKLTMDDYTIVIDGANQLWTNLAKELAAASGKTYIKILFPDITNIVDPISLSALNETTNTDNLYLGPDGRSLYRKFGLCEHLVANLKKFDKEELSGANVLSTKRLDSHDPLTHLTVEELARLNACKSNRAIEVERIPYLNFWDFLNTRVFTKLNPTNELPLSLMAYFLPLIGQYFTLQVSGQPFEQFKEELNNFLTHLYKHDKEEINQFYGLHFEISGKKYYLLDFLIELNNATDYNLDTKLKGLLNALYALNPALYLKTPGASSLYCSAKPVLDGSALNRCRLFLLSLFSYNFNCDFWNKTRISICDKENEVPSQVAQLYKRFSSAISASNEEEMVRVYEAVMDETVAAQAKASSWSKIWACIAPSSFSTWFEAVKTDSLGLQWYDPKLIVHALINFRAPTAAIGCIVEGFLDEAIRTYCQNPPISRFQKHMRINLLFNQLLNDLESAPERDVLLQLLDLAATQDYRASFINNCIHYLGHRLQKINGNRTGDARVSFFAGSRSVEQLKTKIAAERYLSVSEVVEEYRKELEESSEGLSTSRPERRKSLLKYIYDRQSPILTREEEIEAEERVSVELLIRR
ncbi:hypothetical protein [Legionella sp. km772]|uniref:hypothetical protein n=1 Tax=Legionella sp. km772 TaxID=2498111 RepID=UPI000F8F62A3|nr:hypothetical protein [Legionella sp. km772]RUR08292.1 hypothetical protein ELY15_11310 [Legionella sp. km772]